MTYITHSHTEDFVDMVANPTIIALMTHTKKIQAALSLLDALTIIPLETLGNHIYDHLLLSSFCLNTYFVHAMVNA